MRCAHLSWHYCGLTLQVLAAYHRRFDRSIHWTSACYIVCKCSPSISLYQLQLHALFALCLLLLQVSVVLLAVSVVLLAKSRCGRSNELKQGQEESVQTAWYVCARGPVAICVCMYSVYTYNTLYTVYTQHTYSMYSVYTQHTVCTHSHLPHIHTHSTICIIEHTSTHTHMHLFLTLVVHWCNVLRGAGD